MKVEDVRFKWTSGMACPEGIYLDRIYHAVVKNEKIYFSDGNFEKPISIESLKNIFTPTNCTWNEVEFNNKINNKKIVKE